MELISVRLFPEWVSVKNRIRCPLVSGISVRITPDYTYSHSSYKFYYWRTKSGTEVDFIIYGKEGFWAIEVKNTKNVHRNELRPLKTFYHDYPECKPIFVYRGNERLLIDNILCIPCDAFLKSIKPDKPLS